MGDYEMTIKPCCKKMTNEIDNVLGHIEEESGLYIVKSSDGYNIIDIVFCPWCGNKIESWKG